ncbi:MAG: NifU family protein [Rickettsiaceae bacterium]|nr:NifU family protein [Rickettsiaceae bacterium]
MFIQTEHTPNPNALKFVPILEKGVAITAQPIHFGSIDETKGIKLAINLFRIPGVSLVFFGADFITITKNDSETWEFLKPNISSVIMDHFAAGFSALEGMQESKDLGDASIFSEIEKQIIEIIDSKVRPSVAMDGGDITYKGFENGVVYLELKGSCAGCPSSTITLKNGIESMLKYYVPEVESVEAIDEAL